MRRRLMVSGLLLETAVLAVAILTPHPWVYFATSFSLPRGFYLWHRYDPQRPLQQGDLVLLTMPEEVQALLAQSAPALHGLPLLKPVGAVPGDTVCLEGAQVRINGQPVTVRYATALNGTVLPWPDGCWMIGPGAFFPLSTYHPRSIDGRYFGVMAQATIRGRMTPLWTWDVEGGQDGHHGD